MKKWFLCLMAIVAIQVYAADNTSMYLVFTTSDGTQTRLATEGLQLTTANGNLTATNGEGTTTFALTDLTKMVFDESADDSELVADVNGDKAVDVADISNVITIMASNEVDAYPKADVNGDGVVDVADISAVITSMANGNNTDLTVNQTLNVVDSQAIYQIPASQAGEMIYEDGQTLTIMDKIFTLTDISKMYVDDTEVKDSTVTISYTDEGAQVFVAGNVAQYLTVDVTGGHVNIAQDSELPFEVTYGLGGSCSDGEFAMSGSIKATVELRGLTLTNPSGAAINITNGKRIALSVKNGTVNTLVDGEDGEQKAALYCKGHLELKGKGTLNVSGNTAHAIKSGDYTSMKNCTVNILSAIKDGISANEYFLMESGELNISGVGDDGIQVDLDGTVNTGETEGHEEEDSGNIYIEGGKLSVTTTANGAKGLKADSTVVVNGGSLTLNASGRVDTSDASDPSYVAAISGGKFVQNDGDITITVKGIAGRGVKAYDIETNGGELTINNSATPTTISSDVKGAKGLKALNMALNAGTITINMSGNAGKGIRCGDGTKSTSGGNSGPGGGPGGWGPPGGGGPGGGSTTWSNVTGSYTQGLKDGTGPVLTVNTTGSSYSSSLAKAIKAICAVNIYGGTTEVTTKTDEAEGLESKTGINIEGGNHYFKCYDDCLNSAGAIVFDGGITICHSTGNDAVDSNYGKTGAVTIGDGLVFAYTTKGDPEEGLDCDNDSYIQISGNGYAISAGGQQGGGGGWGGSSSSSISNASQGYAITSSPSSYSSSNYYTLADSEGNNLLTYKFDATVSNKHSVITAKGMVKDNDYTIKSSTSSPTDATESFHGIYLGSSAVGNTDVNSFTAK